MPEQRQGSDVRVPARFGAQVLPPLAGEGGVEHVVCAVVDGRPMALTCGSDHFARVWDMNDHREADSAITSEWTIDAVAYGSLKDRPVAVVVAGGIEVWDLSERRRLGRADLSRHLGQGQRAVACTQLDGQLIAVTGGYGGNVRIWDVATATQLGDPLPGAGMITSVACGMLHDSPIALTACGEEGVVRLWDLKRREQIGRPLTGHTGDVHAVAYGRFEGRPIALSASSDHTLRLWDLTAPEPVGLPLNGHAREVRAVALATVAGRVVAVSGGEDVRVWDLRNRRQVGPPLFDGRDAGWVNSLACGTLYGQPVALAAMYHERVRVWDLAEHCRIGFDVPTQLAPRLPEFWTDPATGDIYDLTRPLVDRDGSSWAVVDYDGFEPIVSQDSARDDPYVRFGIADAHQDWDFCETVTPGPGRERHEDKDDTPW